MNTSSKIVLNTAKTSQRDCKFHIVKWKLKLCLNNSDDQNLIKACETSRGLEFIFFGGGGVRGGDSLKGRLVVFSGCEMTAGKTLWICVNNALKPWIPLHIHFICFCFSFLKRNNKEYRQLWRVVHSMKTWEEFSFQITTIKRSFF